MDLNRQALLVMTVAVLGPAAVWHGVRPGDLARTIGRQGVLPGTRGRRARASTWAGLVVVLELAVLAAAVISLFSSTTRVAGALLAAAGAAFVGYVVLLLRRDYRGDCGCSPVAASVTGLSLVPGAALLAAGVVLAVDHSFDDVALAKGSGGFETALTLAAALLIGGLVSLLPASALVGNPVTLRPATTSERGRLEAAPIGAAGAQRPGAEGAKSGDTASFDLSAAGAAEKATVTYPRAL